MSGQVTLGTKPQASTQSQIAKELTTGRMPATEFVDLNLTLSNGETKSLSDILQSQLSSNEIEISKISPPENLPNATLNSSTLEDLLSIAKLSKSLTIADFNIEGTLDLPKDSNIIFSRCIFKEPSVINFNGNELTIKGSEIEDGATLNSLNPEAKILIKNTKLPYKSPNDKKEERSIERTLRKGFLINGIAQDLTISDSTGRVVITDLKLEDKHNNPQHVKFIRKGREITNIDEINKYYRPVMFKRHAHPSILKEWNKTYETNKQKVITYKEKKEKQLSELEKQYMQAKTDGETPSNELINKITNTRNEILRAVAISKGEPYYSCERFAGLDENNKPIYIPILNSKTSTKQNYYYNHEFVKEELNKRNAPTSQESEKLQTENTHKHLSFMSKLKSIFHNGVSCIFNRQNKSLTFECKKGNPTIKPEHIKQLTEILAQEGINIEELTLNFKSFYIVNDLELFAKKIQLDGCVIGANQSVSTEKFDLNNCVISAPKGIVFLVNQGEKQIAYTTFNNLDVNNGEKETCYVYVYGSCDLKVNDLGDRIKFYKFKK